MDNYNLEDILNEDNLQKIDLQIHKCFRVHGIEGTIETIERVYKRMPELKEIWTTSYWKIVRGK